MKYILFSNSEKSRFHIVVKNCFASIFYLFFFVGPLKFIKTLFTYKLAHSNNVPNDFLRLWSLLNIDSDFDFAYTSIQDNTYLKKIIYFRYGCDSKVYKISDDKICMSSLLNEYKYSNIFDLDQNIIVNENFICVSSSFKYLLETVYISRTSLINLISNYVGTSFFLCDDKLTFKSTVHGDIAKRNIKRSMPKFWNLFLIDYELAGVRTMSYDYFYYYTNKFLHNLDRQSVLIFCMHDSKKKLVIANIDLTDKWKDYFCCYLNEWLYCFTILSHDSTFNLRYKQFINNLIQDVEKL